MQDVNQLVRTPLRAVVAALVLVLALAGCTQRQDEDGADQVRVSGSFGSVPTVRFDAPLPLAESSIETLIEGDGRALAADEPVLFALTAYDGADGEPLTERGAGTPRALMLTAEDVGEDLFPVLEGTPEGTRLLLRQPVSEDGTDRMLVLVIDVLHTRARGEEIPLPDGSPAVAVGDDGTPTVQLPGAEPPDALTVHTRVRGEGAQVRPGQDVTLQYTGVVWETGEPYDSTWVPGKVPQTVALEETFPGLRDGLVDQTVGSQVVLVVPPALAVGTGTLVMVVDILAATGDGGDDTVIPSS